MNRDVVIDEVSSTKNITVFAKGIGNVEAESAFYKTSRNTSEA